MSAKNTSGSPAKFAKKLQKWQASRLAKKAENRNSIKHKTLTPKQRIEVKNKTEGNCHICGGKLDKNWHADHVVSHSSGGSSKVDNYLPAHQICNSARKAYTPEEFQWIIKLGVWLRTQIANETTVGKDAAEKFCVSDKNRVKRHVGSKP